MQALKPVFEHNYREDWRKRRPDMDLMISLAERRPDVVDFIEPYTLDPIHGTQVTGQQEDKVTLITIHSAKGLEGRRVFIPQAQYAMYPFVRSMDSEAEIEEERRILYVALTWAQDELLLSSSKTKHDQECRQGDFGQLRSNSGNGSFAARTRSLPATRSALGLCPNGWHYQYSNSPRLIVRLRLIQLRCRVEIRYQTLPLHLKERVIEFAHLLPAAARSDSVARVLSKSSHRVSTPSTIAAGKVDQTGIRLESHRCELELTWS